MSSAKSTVYFPGLNGIRFIAAFGVMMMHIEYLKAYWGAPNAYMHPVVYEIPRTFVTLFFVLSGFLITYLLLKEKQDEGRIAIRKFYLRRILRIWPLYLLIVLLAFFVLPHFDIFFIPYMSGELPDQFTEKLLLFLLFLPQLALVLFVPVPFAEPAWSVGVEEQFYLIWPLFIRFSKKLLRAILLFIAFLFLLKFAAYFVEHFYPDSALGEYAGIARRFLYFNRLETIAIGGISGYVLFMRKDKWLGFIYHPLTQVFTFAALATLFCTGYTSHIVNHSLYAVLYAIVILNVASNPKSYLKLENKALNYLGKISFGIYLLHEIGVQISIYYLSDYLFDPSTFWQANVALYAMSIVITLVLASVTYYGFERFFLRLKPRPGIER
jgi:peptidoglycan/LPS O-acetylase OafA/YrhL